MGFWGWVGSEMDIVGPVWVGRGLRWVGRGSYPLFWPLQLAGYREALPLLGGQVTRERRCAL